VVPDPQQRVALIAQMHGTNPIQVRTWLSAAWKQEKAELRHDLLAALDSLSAASRAGRRLGSGSPYLRLLGARDGLPTFPRIKW
jgi:hypothetical protein